MIGPASNTRVWLVAGATDMRRGFDGLSAQVQTPLASDPFSGHLFIFRGCRGDRVKILWWDGDGLCLFYKSLERGRFIWPRAEEGAVHLSAAQLSMRDTPYLRGSLEFHVDCSGSTGEWR